MTRDTYRVVVTHEGDELLATVPGLPGASTFGRTHAELEASVREVVILAVGLPDDAVNAFDLEWVEGPARKPAAI